MNSILATTAQYRHLVAWYKTLHILSESFTNMWTWVNKILYGVILPEFRYDNRRRFDHISESQNLMLFNLKNKLYETIKYLNSK